MIQVNRLREVEDGQAGPELSGLRGGPQPRKTRLIFILWVVGMASLVILAMFCWFIVSPYLEVRSAVRRLTWEEGNTPEDLVRDLGGAKHAAQACSVFLRCPPWLASYEGKERASLILGACGEPGFNTARLLVCAQDAQLRVHAVVAIGAMRNPRALELLVGSLRDPDCDVRLWAAKALGNLGDPRAIGPLTEVMVDPSKKEPRYGEVRSAAAEALGKVGGAERLIAVLEHPDVNVRSSTIVGLGRLKSARALQALLYQLRDPSARIRALAAWSLGELGDPRAAELLKTASSDENWEVRTAAAAALRKIGEGDQRP